MPALGAQRPADADLAGPLRDGGQHDVHDADAANDQRDRSNRPQHEREDPLRLLGLLQQIERDRDGEILLRVKLFEQALNDVGRFLDMFHPVNGHGELADFQLLGLIGAGTLIGNDLAEADLVSVVGDIDIAVVILSGETAADAGGRGSPLRHANHGVEMALADLHRMANGVLDGKEHLSGVAREHGDVGEVVIIHLVEKPAAAHAQAVQFEEVGRRRHHSALQLALAVAKFLAEFPHRCDGFDRRDGAADALQVLRSQPVVDHAARLVRVEVVDGLDAADDDIAGAQILDLLNRLVPGSLADRQHDDH